MSAAAARPKTGFKFMLIVKGGPDKGVSYQLLPPKVTIGRDPSSNISLSDPRVSRHAAIIDFSMERIVISDLSSRQTLIVDGIATSQAEIADGSLIKVGDTQLLFAVEALQLGSFALQDRSGAVAARPAAATAQLHTHQPTGYAAAPPRARAPQPARSPVFTILVGLVIAACLYVGLSENAKQKARRGITTSTDIQKEIDSSEKLQDDLKKKRKFSSDEEKTRYEEANRHYLEGFRDYQNLQYSRALRSFETALAIDPAHDLARRYYNLAQKQRDDMVASLILEGRTYRDKLMYGRCSSALEKALNFMTNKDDLKYKQAESMKRECDLLVDGRN